jgi:hypothetical protein
VSSREKREGEREGEGRGGEREGGKEGERRMRKREKFIFFYMHSLEFSWSIPNIMFLLYVVIIIVIVFLFHRFRKIVVGLISSS